MSASYQYNMSKMNERIHGYENNTSLTTTPLRNTSHVKTCYMNTTNTFIKNISPTNAFYASDAMYSPPEDTG